MRKLSLGVLTICRNDLEGLQKTVSSVAAQTRAPDEFLVLDGASRNGIVEFLQGCRTVTSWKSEPDEGIADAFNKVALMARADWIIFLNAGDALTDSKVLEDFEAILEELPPEIGVCYGDTLLITPSAKGKRRRLNGSHDFFGHVNTICHQAAFVRRDLQAAYPYDGRLRIGMDYDLWLRLLSVTGFRHVDRVVCDYRLGGISSSKEWAEHSIIAHQMVNWLNRRGKKLGFRDVIELVKSLLALRTKKAVERLFGDRIYGMIRDWKR